MTDYFEKCRWNIARLAANIIRIGAAGGFASEPASGLVWWELWQILTFSFFWVKPKEQREKLAETNISQNIASLLSLPLEAV